MNRDRKGKYSHSDMEKMCKCGHRLGRHTAEYPHDCCYGDGDDYDQKCDCNGFKLKGKKCSCGHLPKDHYVSDVDVSLGQIFCDRGNCTGWQQCDLTSLPQQ